MCCLYRYLGMSVQCKRLFDEECDEPPLSGSRPWEMDEAVDFVSGARRQLLGRPLHPECPGVSLEEQLQNSSPATVDGETMTKEKEKGNETWFF